MSISGSQQTYYGWGSIEHLSSILRAHKPKTIFLVTGRKSFDTSGAADIIRETLSPYTVVHFSDFSSNPKIEDVKKGIAAFRKRPIDIVCVVGGGSAIDIAKSVNLLAQHNVDPEVLIRNEAAITHNAKPSVVIPTTAGTGSEATSFAVVYIGKTKYSLEHPSLLPTYAVVDPQFTTTLSPYQTAVTGMDALTQAVESFWAVDATDVSKKYAQEAILLVRKHFLSAVQQGTRIAREGMALAAYRAGQAINISKTTACHAISYPMTSRFNIPHGQAVCVTLPSLLIFNAGVSDDDVVHPLGAAYVQQCTNELVSILGCSTIHQAQEWIADIMQTAGLAARLGELGIKTQEDRDYIVSHLNLGRMKNNPRRLTKDDLYKLLKDIT